MKMEISRIKVTERIRKEVTKIDELALDIIENGLLKTSYDRAKYISENAPDEIIAELDRSERSIRGAYEELRAKERDEQLPVTQERGNHFPNIQKFKQRIISVSKTRRQCVK